MVTLGKIVLKVFVDFYKTLFSPLPDFVVTNLHTFLDNLALLTLPVDTRVMLDALFTEEEVPAAIGSFDLNCKSQGHDGLSEEWYNYAEELSPRLLHLYMDCLIRPITFLCI